MKHVEELNHYKIIADFVWQRFGKNIKLIADVAGGKGELGIFLAAKYDYMVDVIDPLGKESAFYTLRHRKFDPRMADDYDLIIGFHPDEATRSIAEAALRRPTILIPCCNYWGGDVTSYESLLDSIEKYFNENHVHFEKQVISELGERNTVFITTPPMV